MQPGAEQLLEKLLPGAVEPDLSGHAPFAGSAVAGGTVRVPRGRNPLHQQACFRDICVSIWEPNPALMIDDVEEYCEVTGNGRNRRPE